VEARNCDSILRMIKTLDQIISPFWACLNNHQELLLTSSCLSVRHSAFKDSSPTGRTFMKFGIWVFFENLLRKFKFNYSLTRITATLREDRHTIFIVSRSILLLMRNHHHYHHHKHQGLDPLIRSVSRVTAAPEML
jgi:hypothetical protein